MRPLLIAFLTVVGVPAMLLAQNPPATGHQHGQAPSQEQAPAPDQHEHMMQMHQQMMAQMTAMDQKLDGLVAQMNGAQGPARVDAMAAVLTELVNQRKQMREQMASMMGPGGMMGGGRGSMGGMMGEQHAMTMGTTGGGTMLSPTVDPVCRARIADGTAPTATYQGKTYQFCSEADKREFLKDPAKYVK